MDQQHERNINNLSRDDGNGAAVASPHSEMCFYAEELLK